MSGGDGTGLNAAGRNAEQAASNNLKASAPEIELDSGERRLNELGYKQELRREMVIFLSSCTRYSTEFLFTALSGPFFDHQEIAMLFL